MFDKGDMRGRIALVWLLSFIILWTMFCLLLPLKTMNSQLDNIEQSIASDNWKQANEYTAQFIKTYEKSRYFIQTNNSTEILTSFEYIIGQLDLTVKYNQDSALEYIGALRASLNFVVKPFAGP